MSKDSCPMSRFGEGASVGKRFKPAIRVVFRYMQRACDSVRHLFAGSDGDVVRFEGLADGLQYVRVDHDGKIPCTHEARSAACEAYFFTNCFTFIPLTSAI